MTQLYSYMIWVHYLENTKITNRLFDPESVANIWYSPAFVHVVLVAELNAMRYSSIVPFIYLKVITFRLSAVTAWQLSTGQYVTV